MRDATFINYETSNFKQYKAQVGRSENMQYHEDEDSYVCAGRKLELRRENTTKTALVSMKQQRITAVQTVVIAFFRNVCRRPRDGKVKELQIKPEFREHRAVSLQNISTGGGILLRMNRSTGKVPLAC